MKCPECGAEIANNAAMCPRCGSRLDVLRAAQPTTLGPGVTTTAVPGAMNTAPPAPPVAPGAIPVPPPLPVTGTFPTGTNPPQNSHDPHEDLWQGGYSPKAMIGTILTAVVLTIAAFVVGLIFSHGIVWAIAAGIAIVAWIVVLGTFARRRLGVHYRLTTQRFFHEHGLVRRITDRIEVIAIDEISVEQGPIERMLGIGSIKIRSGDQTDPILILRGIDDVQRVADIIDEARRAERNRRSVRMETI